MFIENDGFFKAGTEYWFIGRNDDILYKLNESLECTPVAFLSDEGEDFYRYHQKCVVYDNKVFCLPDRAKYIAVYDMVKESLEKIAIPKGENHRLSILYSFRNDDSIYCVSSGTGTIYEVSLTDCKIKDEYAVFDKQSVAEDEYSCDESVQLDGKIFCVSHCEPHISIFDMCTKDIQKIELNTNEKGFNTITYTEGVFLLTGYKENLYIWDGKSDDVKAYPINRKNFFNRDCKNDYYLPLFINSYSCGKKVILTLFNQLFGKGLLIVVLENGVTDSVIRDDREYKYGNHYVIESASDRDAIVFFDGDDFARHLKVDTLQWETVVNMKKSRPKEAILSKMNAEMRNGVLKESVLFDLDDFMYCIK